ncbi:Uncharacterised protein [Mycobacteroides abscessus subsp. abscessus]|nr:Uncharacterised protein [Mycobacteroides abscessus subsp. abscessus]
MFRNGTIANSMVPNHVVSGGWNFFLPLTVSMATISAIVGSVISTRQMPTSNARVPRARTNRIVVWSPLPAGACDVAVDTRHPPKLPITSIRAGTGRRPTPLPTMTSARRLPVEYSSNGHD